MSKFCSNCGAQTNPYDKFCTNCGVPLASDQLPSQTENVKEEKIAFLDSEEEKVEIETVSSDEDQLVESDIQSEPVLEQTRETMSMSEPDKIGDTVNTNQNFNAACTIGETALENIKNTGLETIPGPFKVVGASVKQLFVSIKSLFKDPKKMIPMLIIAVIWIVLDILKACGINPLFTQILSFLTFANGGMNGGVIGAIGGIIGKGIFAGAFTILIGLFSKKNKGEKKSFGEIIKGAFSISLNTLFASLTGIGCAILLFLFISGGATRISFMGGIAMMLVFAKAAIHNEFLQKFISSIFYKGKTKAGCGVQGFVRGLSIGSAIGALIGLIGINLILIIIGCFLILGGTIMMILQKKGVIKFGKGENTK